MIGRISCVTAVVALAMGLASPAASAPIHPLAIGPEAKTGVEAVSFWGLYYPYGYAYSSRKCIRYVRVKTRHGWRHKRIWVCD